MLTRFIPPFRSEIPPQSEKVAAQSARFPIVAKGASLRRIPIGEVSSAGVMLSRLGKRMRFVCSSSTSCPQLFAIAAGTSATKRLSCGTCVITKKPHANGIPPGVHSSELVGPAFM